MDRHLIGMSGDGCGKPLSCSGLIKADDDDDEEEE